jgi:hypothetical protein
MRVAAMNDQSSVVMNFFCLIVGTVTEVNI